MTISIEHAAGLFQIADATRLYRDLREELVAVKDGRKGISVYEVSTDNVGEVCDFEAEAQQLSLRTERRHSAKAARSLFVFAFHPDQAWRIAAYMAFIELPMKWTDGAEFLHSFLLGYTSEQATQWIRAFNDRKIGWNGETMFIAMSDQQKELVLNFYSRILPYDNSQQMLAFIPSSECLAMRLDAAQLIPSDTSLARVSVDALYFGIRLLSSTYTGDLGDIFFDTCTKGLVSNINRHMTSGIQFLDNGRWLTYRQLRQPDNSADDTEA